MRLTVSQLKYYYTIFKRHSVCICLHGKSESIVHKKFANVFMLTLIKINQINISLYNDKF